MGQPSLNEITAAYLTAVAAGDDPDPAQWLTRYPELAKELTEFFAGQEKINRVTLSPPTLRPATVAQEQDDPTAALSAGEATVGPPATPRRQFGDYELLHEIARGGMGVVYRARQISLNRVVALKMILAGQFASSADVKRFHTEAEAAVTSITRISCPSTTSASTRGSTISA
jgi:serine/threonine-protein kinase